jgi:hypothetical protein
MEAIPPPLRDLVEDYLDGLLDETGLEELEQHLRADGAARHYFVRYARLHTDLELEVRARKAGQRALERIEQLAASRTRPAATTVPASTPPRSFFLAVWSPWNLGIAAGLLLAVVAGWALAWRGGTAHGAEGEPAIAWLVNAQDCTWAGPGPTGNLQAGRRLQIEHGLAEIHFDCGARVVLEGPCVLELLSGKSARLASGRLTARVPAGAQGFEVLSPHGKVIDLGTEFGVQADQGLTEVYVFKGKVEALPAHASRAESLTEHQAAEMGPDRVTIRASEAAAPESRFVRAIEPSPRIVPRTRRLVFDEAPEGGIGDQAGLGTGLTHRLPGTGETLAAHDPNLRLNRALAQLELTTTNSDLNTRYKLGHGEYLGLHLADLGFTGPEDFAVTVTIPNIPALGAVGQFGLYAGTQSDRTIRGGLIGHEEPGQYTQFLVKNDNGCDLPDICKVGLLSTGTDLRLTLKRTAGRYALTVENLTRGSTSTLTIRHPEFLDDARDLYVGLFGANTQSEIRKTLIFKNFQATVWTVDSRSD